MFRKMKCSFRDRVTWLGWGLQRFTVRPHLPCPMTSHKAVSPSVRFDGGGGISLHFRRFTTPTLMTCKSASLFVTYLLTRMVGGG